jgi:hypothetical protein
MFDSGSIPAALARLMKTATRADIIFILAASLALALWLIGAQIFKARWGINDDHDTISFIGAGHHHLPAGDYLRVLFTRTELGAIGSYPRFRPFYYPALLGEAVVWGDNVHLWYASRTVQLALFLAAVWIVIARHLGILVGLAAILATFQVSFWGDIWARLGTGELYATVALGVWLLGIDGMFTPTSARVHALALFAVPVGMFMMIGSKETLFPFVGYSAAALAIYIALHPRASIPKILLVATFVLGGISGTVIYQALSRAKQDALGRSIDASERLAHLLPPFAGSLIKFVLPSLVLIGLGAVLSRAMAKGQNWHPRWQKLSAIYGIGVLILWSLYLSQYVAYDGQWPTGYRYDFPGQLALPGLVVISVMYVTELLKSVDLAPVAKVLTAIAALAVIIGSLVYRPFPLTLAVERNIDRTAAFEKVISALAAAAKANPAIPIIFRANGAWASYEPIVSVSVFLRLYYEVKNPIAVKFYPDPKETSNVMTALAASIRDWQLHGREHIVPLNAVEATARAGCLSAGFGGSVEPGCQGNFLF